MYIRARFGASKRVAPRWWSTRCCWPSSPWSASWRSRPSAARPAASRRDRQLTRMSGPDRQRSSFDAATEAVLLASRAVVAIAARSLAAWAEVTLVQFRALVLLDRDGTLSAGRPAELLVVAIDGHRTVRPADRKAACRTRTPSSEPSRGRADSGPAREDHGRQRHRRPSQGTGSLP